MKKKIPLWTCPVCTAGIYENYRKRHLKERHGWKYTPESPTEPQEVS